MHRLFPPLPRHGQRPAVGLPLGTEWLCMTVLLLGLVFWLSAPGTLARLNGWIQDLNSRLLQRQATPDVVMVVADEASIAAIGRWPWRRALHAKVIQHISGGQPLSIGMDILFTEPDLDYPEDDWLLAQAIADSGRVVLPVMPQPYGSSVQPLGLPLPEFVQAAARLAHTHLPIDADGSIRSFYALEGPTAAPWLHMGLAMRCLPQPNAPLCQDSASKPIARQFEEVAPWEHRTLMHIGFARGQPAFPTYAYIDVLRGKIPATAFRGKHVVLGVKATGLSVALPAPGHDARQTAHNVELVAHILHGALQEQHTRSASLWANRLFNALPVLLTLLALAWCGPSAALLTGVALGLATLLATGLASLWWQLTFSPGAALLAIAVAYPLWSWRRLNAAARFLNHSMQELQAQGLPMLAARPAGDFLQQRIQAVEQATTQLHQLHEFVTQTLQQLPSPTLACDSQGCVILANSAAHAYAASLGRRIEPRQPVAALLEGSMERGTLQPLWNPQQLPSTSETVQREGIDLLKNSLLMLCRPFVVGAQHGWLVSLVDISALREALAQRDEAMHFISHDIRAPVGAILTVLEMEQHFSQQSSASPLLMERIERYARNALELADDFIHLARVQHTRPKQEPVELGQVIDQALDDTWAAAHARFVRVDWMPQETEAWVHGDASMLRRACVNLISNAIKYGPVEGTVFCTLTHHADAWLIAIRDQGEGISPEEQARLFAPFTRQHQHERSSIQGAGLGLAYVHTVATQHGGSITVDSTPGQGSTFTLRLPSASTPPAQ